MTHKITNKSTCIFCTAALALAFSMPSCTDSNQASDTDSPADNAVRFAARTDFSRAGEFTTNNLTSFNVFAYTDTDSIPTLFMDNVEVSKTSTNTWTYAPIKYWPAHKTVDFYAFAPAEWVGAAGPLSPVAYDAYPGTDDIIYAVSSDLSGTMGSNAQVVMNFRHALAKVTIRLSSSNSNLTVKVSNVALANIMTKGNFHFPDQTTSGQPTAHNTGSWTGQNTPVPYVLHVSQSPSDLITLTTTPTDMGDTGMGLGGAKFMIPQTLSYRSNGAGADNYLTVMCSVYDTASGDKLWPNANTPSENIVEGSTFGDGLLKFALNTSKFSAWQHGYHYIYNVVINANDEMGQIEFGTPTVDTYVDVESTYE